jgi:hypothetical protein
MDTYTCCPGPTSCRYMLATIACLYSAYASIVPSTLDKSKSRVHAVRSWASRKFAELSCCGFVRSTRLTNDTLSL